MEAKGRADNLNDCLREIRLRFGERLKTSIAAYDRGKTEINSGFEIRQISKWEIRRDDTRDSIGIYEQTRIFEQDKLIGEFGEYKVEV